MSRELSCLVSVRVDFNFCDPCYVLKLASSYARDSTDYILAAALSNNQIKVFHQSSVDLRAGCALQGHSDRVTDLSLPIYHSPWMVLSSSEDKTIKLWDTRSRQLAEEYVYRCCSCRRRLESCLNHSSNCDCRCNRSVHSFTGKADTADSYVLQESCTLVPAPTILLPEDLMERSGSGTGGNNKSCSASMTHTWTW